MIKHHEENSNFVVYYDNNRDFFAKYKNPQFWAKTVLRFIFYFYSNENQQAVYFSKNHIATERRNKIATEAKGNNENLQAPVSQ